MIKLNSYLLSQRPALREFVGKISTQSPSLEDEREEIQENFPLLEPLRTLAFYLHKHSDVIKLAFKNSTDVDEQASLQKLSDLLAQVTLEDDPAPIQDLQVEQKNFQLKIRRVISSTMSSRTDENHWFPRDVVANRAKDDTAMNSPSPTLRRTSATHNSAVIRPLAQSDNPKIFQKRKSEDPLDFDPSTSLPNLKRKNKRPKIRRLVWSRSEKSRTVQTEADEIEDLSGLSVEEENEKLRASMEALKLQVQMLAERNADLRRKNEELAIRNEELESSLTMWQGGQPKKPKSKVPPINTPKSRKAEGIALGRQLRNSVPLIHSPDRDAVS